MTVDLIRYDILAQDALRGVVRRVLSDAAKKGLPGDHHFFITFYTHEEGVRLSPRLLQQYPEEMTIVLQHQFWDLKVSDQSFEVGLSFGGVVETLFVPFAAIKGFADPSVKFMLQFETLAEAPEEAEEPTATPAPRADTPAEPPAAKAPAPAKPARTSVPTAPRAVPTPVTDDKPPPPDKPSGEVVRLDRFRKK